MRVSTSVSTTVLRISSSKVSSPPLQKIGPRPFHHTASSTVPFLRSILRPSSTLAFFYREILVGEKNCLHLQQITQHLEIHTHTYTCIHIIQLLSEGNLSSCGQNSDHPPQPRFCCLCHLLIMNLSSTVKPHHPSRLIYL